MARLTERAGLLALAAFLVVDVALVAFAVASTREPVEGGGRRLDSSATASTSGPTPTSSGTSPGQPAVEVVPTAVGIVGVNDKSAFRFTVGSCGKGGAELELTTNGGESWVPRAAPFDTLVRVRVRSDGSAFAIGALQEECRPAIKQTGSVEDDFGDVSDVSDAWYRDPRAAESIGLPNGSTGKPCGAKGTVVDLAVIDSGAHVLCANGAVRSSTNGQSWKDVKTVRGALAIALRPQGGSYAVVPGADGCRGLGVVATSDPDQALGCVETDLKAVKPGSVALSITATRAWLSAGGAVFTADEGLADWSKA
jgi:hypothetical protein